MTKANIVLAAAAVVFAAGCFVLFKDLSAERNRVKALETQVASLQRDITADMNTSEPAKADTAVLTVEPPAQTARVKPAVPAATPASRAPTAAKPAAAQEQWRAVLADPEYRKSRLAEHRLRMQRGYREIVAALGLSQSEAERFLDLLAEQSLRDTELAFREQPGRDPMRQRRELHAQSEKERQAFLGEERFQTWVEFVNSAGARGFVSELRTELATTSSPLREEQIKPLVKALAAEHQRHEGERQENYWSFRDENDVDGQQSAVTPTSVRSAYMERRAAMIEESLRRQQEAGEMYLDSVQQREFNVLLERRREQARLDFESWRTHMEAEERRRARPR